MTQPWRRILHGPPGGPADHCDLGDHLHLHQGAAGGFPASGDLVYPVHDGLSGAAGSLSSPPGQGVTRRQEGLFALAGLCGVCLYYLLENIALTYTMASNVGVIISVSPCFTALLTHFLMRGEERLRPTFFAGFAVAMAGICLISFNGSALELDLRGDLLALLAAFVWACYALLSRKISALGHPLS